MSAAVSQCDGLLLSRLRFDANQVWLRFDTHQDTGKSNSVKASSSRDLSPISRDLSSTVPISPADLAHCPDLSCDLVSGNSSIPILSSSRSCPQGPGNSTVPILSHFMAVGAKSSPRRGTHHCRPRQQARAHRLGRAARRSALRCQQGVPAKSCEATKRSGGLGATASATTKAATRRKQEPIFVILFCRMKRHGQPSLARKPVIWTSATSAFDLRPPPSRDHPGAVHIKRTTQTPYTCPSTDPLQHERKGSTRGSPEIVSTKATVTGSSGDQLPRGVACAKTGIKHPKRSIKRKCSLGLTGGVHTCPADLGRSCAVPILSGPDLVPIL